MSGYCCLNNIHQEIPYDQNEGTFYEFRRNICKKLKYGIGIFILGTAIFLFGLIIDRSMIKTCSLTQAKNIYNFSSLGIKSYLLIVNSSSWVGWIQKPDDGRNYIITFASENGIIENNSSSLTTLNWNDGPLMFPNGSTNKFETFNVSRLNILMEYIPYASVTTTTKDLLFIHVLFSCSVNCSIYSDDSNRCVKKVSISNQKNKFFLYNVVYDNIQVKKFILTIENENGLIYLQGIAIS